MVPSGNDRPPLPTPPPAPTKRPPAGLIPGGGVALALILVIGLFLLLFDPFKRITYSEFEQLVEAGQVKTLKLVGTTRADGEVRSTDHELVKNMKLTGGQFSVMLPQSDNQYQLIDRVKAADKKYREEQKKQ